MSTFDRKAHWETIYKTKPLEKVSWYQPKPTTSLELIGSLNLPKDAAIIDIGGGDSFLVDHLIELGFTNLTVLDISKSAIDRAKKRLGDNSEKIIWIESDILDFQPEISYDLWHDRAALHFLTSNTDIKSYVSLVTSSIQENGAMVVGTFSENGPTKCSGIPVKQYSSAALSTLFAGHFECIQQLQIDHETPFDTIQNFTFGVFRHK